MEDLKARLKALLHEIEYVYLKKKWVDKMITSGIDEQDAYKWVAEIGHVVDEYERSLRFLIDSLEEDDVNRTIKSLEGWVAYTRDMTIWKIDDAMKELDGVYKKYLPPEDNLNE